MSNENLQQYIKEANDDSSDLLKALVGLDPKALNFNEQFVSKVSKAKSANKQELKKDLKPDSDLTFKDLQQQALIRLIYLKLDNISDKNFKELIAADSVQKIQGILKIPFSQNIMNANKITEYFAPRIDKVDKVLQNNDLEQLLLIINDEEIAENRVKQGEKGKEKEEEVVKKTSGKYQSFQRAAAAQRYFQIIASSFIDKNLLADLSKVRDAQSLKKLIMGYSLPFNKELVDFLKQRIENNPEIIRGVRTQAKINQVIAELTLNQLENFTNDLENLADNLLPHDENAKNYLAQENNLMWVKKHITQQWSKKKFLSLYSDKKIESFHQEKFDNEGNIVKAYKAAAEIRNQFLQKSSQEIIAAIKAENYNLDEKDLEIFKNLPHNDKELLRQELLLEWVDKTEEKNLKIINNTSLVDLKEAFGKLLDIKNLSWLDEETLTAVKERALNRSLHLKIGEPVSKPLKHLINNLSRKDKQALLKRTNLKKLSTLTTKASIEQFLGKQSADAEHLVKYNQEQTTQEITSPALKTILNIHNKSFDIEKIDKVNAELELFYDISSTIENISVLVEISFTEAEKTSLRKESNTYREEEQRLECTILSEKIILRLMLSSVKHEIGLNSDASNHDVEKADLKEAIRLFNDSDSRRDFIEKLKSSALNKDIQDKLATDLTSKRFEDVKRLIAQEFNQKTWNLTTENNEFTEKNFVNIDQINQSIETFTELLHTTRQRWEDLAIATRRQESGDWFKPEYQDVALSRFSDTQSLIEMQQQLLQVRDQLEQLEQDNASLLSLIPENIQNRNTIRDLNSWTDKVRFWVSLDRTVQQVAASQRNQLKNNQTKIKDLQDLYEKRLMWVNALLKKRQTAENVTQEVELRGLFNGETHNFDKKNYTKEEKILDQEEIKEYFASKTDGITPPKQNTQIIFGKDASSNESNSNESNSIEKLSQKVQAHYGLGSKKAEIGETKAYTYRNDKDKVIGKLAITKSDTVNKKEGIQDFKQTLTVEKDSLKKADEGEKVRVLVDGISRLLMNNHSKRPPSKDNPIILRGSNEQELEMCWAILVHLGKSNPYMKFGEDAIEIRSDALDLNKRATKVPVLGLNIWNKKLDAQKTLKESACKSVLEEATKNYCRFFADRDNSSDRRDLEGTIEHTNKLQSRLEHASAKCKQGLNAIRNNATKVTNAPSSENTGTVTVNPSTEGSSTSPGNTR